MQAASDIFLGWLRTTGRSTAIERDFYVRQLWDWKGSVDRRRDRCPTALAALRARSAAATLARAHARSGDRDRDRRLPRQGRRLRPRDRRLRRGLRRPERARLRRSCRQGCRARAGAEGRRASPRRDEARRSRRMETRQMDASELTTPAEPSTRGCRTRSPRRAGFATSAGAPGCSSGCLLLLLGLIWLLAETYTITGPMVCALIVSVVAMPRRPRARPAHAARLAAALVLIAVAAIAVFIVVIVVAGITGQGAEISAAGRVRRRPVQGWLKSAGVDSSSASGAAAPRSTRPRAMSRRSCTASSTASAGSPGPVRPFVRGARHVLPAQGRAADAALGRPPRRTPASRRRA